jgi:hypothetical protein
MEMAQALKEWHEFYLLIGTAGATLLALLFVACSLGVGYLTEDRQAGTRMFMSPVVIQFTAVFFISAITLVPSHHTPFFAALIGVTAVVGIAVSSVITVQIIRTDFTDYWPDHLAYGALPAIAYVALLITAIMIYLGSELALDLLAGALLVLAIVNIRNAWDLRLTMVRRHPTD